MTFVEEMNTPLMHTSSPTTVACYPSSAVSMMEELGEQLLDACLSDDLDHAAWLLRKYENQNLVNWKDIRSHVSILHLTSYHNLAKATQLLLNNGADPNAVNKVDYQPITFYF